MAEIIPIDPPYCDPTWLPASQVDCYKAGWEAARQALIKAAPLAGPVDASGEPNDADFRAILDAVQRLSYRPERKEKMLAWLRAALESTTRERLKELFYQGFRAARDRPELTAPAAWEIMLNAPMFDAAAAVPSSPAQDGPIRLSDGQENAVKSWAADDRLWTTQETVEFNLRTLARFILILTDRSALPPFSPVADPQPIVLPTKAEVEAEGFEAVPVSDDAPSPSIAILDPSSEAGQRIIRNSAFERPLTQGDPPPSSHVADSRTMNKEPHGDR